MRKVITLVLCWISLSINGLLAQENQFSVSGNLKDTINFLPLAYTSIALINEADSVLHSFTRANEDGTFEILAHHAGKYLILINHPSFATLVDEIDIQSSRTDMGEIHLISKTNLLKEVIINEQRAIIIKGDTVEYAADSFKVREFDNVDELLKRLPGIEVDRQGNIKAYGQNVQKMYVDGEEFFSDDPAVVAKTLRASMVDKVQVFDKKSEEAEFTGIDDGEIVKAINLALKDDAKQGYMGKISAGGGLPEYWENIGMINAFKDKRKISAFGVMSNTNNTGLNWGDANLYGGGGGGISVVEGSAIVTTFMNAADDEFNMGWGGQYNGEGLPQTANGGLHYSNKWWEDQLSFNGNYKYGNNKIENVNNSLTQYILPDTQYFNSDNSQAKKSFQSNNISTFTELQIDSSSSVRLNLSGGYLTSETQELSATEAFDRNNNTINSSYRDKGSIMDRKNINGNLTYQKKFVKQGRSLRATAGFQWTESEGNGYLKSQSNFDAIDSLTRIDQSKTNNAHNLNSRFDVNYTEPLMKNTYLLIKYELQINNQESERLSYDILENEEDQILNSLNSSHYLYNVLSNRGGVGFRYNRNSLNVSVGSDIGNTDYKQNDLLRDTTYNYAALNFFPFASIRYNLKKQSSIHLNYNGNTRQPTLNQLQPIQVNDDPLNVFIGNPNLEQEFNHTLNMSYHSYGVLSGRSIYINANVSIKQNAITQNQTIDELGRRTYQYINTNGNISGGAFAHYSFKINAIPNLMSSFRINGHYSRSENFINNLENTNVQYRISPAFQLSYRKDTTFNISYDFSPNYNNHISSIRRDIETEYWSFTQSVDGRVHLPLNFTLGSSVDWHIRERIVETQKDNNVFQWNVYLSKSFLKDRSLVAKLYAYDILNQNIGYSRFQSTDMITENNYNRIMRYVMLSITWNFTKTGSTAPDSGGIMILGE